MDLLKRTLRITLIFVSLLVASAHSFAQGEPSSALASDLTPPLNVVFLGNSLTGFNNLPGLFRSLANSKGFHPYVEAYLKFGQGLGVHLSDPKVVQGLKSKHWDYIVLQDYSNLALSDPNALLEHVRAVKKLGLTGQIVLAENWGYRDQSDEIQAELDKAYKTLGDETGASVIYLGHAFSAIKQKMIDKVYLPNDDRHPTALATYMLASMYLESFYGTDPHTLARVGCKDNTSDEFWGEASVPTLFDLQDVYSPTELNWVQDTAFANAAPLRGHALSCEGVFTLAQ